MTKGRKAPDLPTFTFKDSGITVQIRKLSPLTLNDLAKTIRKELPEPVGPKNAVDYGDGKVVMESNLADPDYQQALAAYENSVNAEIGERLIKLIALRAVICDVDTEAVQELREDMINVGVTLDPDDKQVYVRHLCIQSAEDMEEIRDAVMRRSQPTEEVIKENLDSFRDNVSGS